MDQDRPLELRLRLELGEQAVDVVDVPGALDLGHHHDLELVADLGDQGGQVVEHPGALQRVDPGPERRLAEVGLLRRLDQALAGGLLAVDRDRVLEVAEQDVGLLGDAGRLFDHLLVREVEEVDHPRRLDGDLAQRLGGADRQGLEEISGVSHGREIYDRAEAPVRTCAGRSPSALSSARAPAGRRRARGRSGAASQLKAWTLIVALVGRRLEGDRERDRGLGAVLDPVRARGAARRRRRRAAGRRSAGCRGSHSMLRWPPPPKVCSSSSCSVSASGNSPTTMSLSPRTWSRKLCSGSVWEGVIEFGAERKMKPSRRVIPPSRSATSGLTPSSSSLSSAS